MRAVHRLAIFALALALVRPDAKRDASTSDAAAYGSATRSAARSSTAASTDSTRLATAESDSVLKSGASFRALSGRLSGLMSVNGLPPEPGTLELFPGSVIFSSDLDGSRVAYPLYRTVYSDTNARRRLLVQLTAVEPGPRAPIYLFHLDGAVFETSSPGMLKQLLDNPGWVDSLEEASSNAERPLVDPTDSTALAEAVRSLATSSYADTLFQIFGMPEQPVGLVGPKGQAAGRLGEYIASRDSVSLSPGRMTSFGQMRHGLAHELAHRLQRKDGRTIRDLWKDVPEIGDPLRYGYGNKDEHQAEAIAFAVHYLQATAAPALDDGYRRELLGAYERLVPGTAIFVRHFLTRPIYLDHPLAGGRLDAPVTAPAAQPVLSAASLGPRRTVPLRRPVME